MLWDRFQQFKELISLLFCLGFSILSLIWNGNLAVKAVASSQKVTDSVSSYVDSFGGFFKGMFTRLQTYESLRKERDSFQKLIEEYRNLPQDMEALKAENLSLRKELGFKPKSSYTTLKAEVLSVRLNSIYRTIIIDKGQNDNIRPYMPVVARATNETGEVVMALVGKVISTGSTTSVVQPLINSNFNMGVQIKDTNLWASLSGNSGKGTMAILNYLDSSIIITPKTMKPEGPFNPEQNTEENTIGIQGKMVLSSSGGGLFPANIPVGYIVEEGPRTGSFKTAYIKPYVRFEDMQYVSVVLKLPDKWVEEWPEEKNVAIENPYYGIINFPGDKDEKPGPPAKEAPKPKDEKKTNQKPPVKKPTLDLNADVEELERKLQQ